MIISLQIMGWLSFKVHFVTNIAVSEASTFKFKNVIHSVKRFLGLLDIEQRFCIKVVHFCLRIFLDKRLEKHHDFKFHAATRWRCQHLRISSFSRIVISCITCMLNVAIANWNYSDLIYHGNKNITKKLISGSLEC